MASFFMPLASLIFPAISWGQAHDNPPLDLPECDIFLFDLDDSATELKVSNGRNVTNRPGYDNQPWFTPDSQSFLYSANFAPDRTDVYEYRILEGKSQQVTDSPTQEYSPQISPDNKTLSFVTDGETANQSVWFGERDSQEFQWLLENQGEREPVGYYSWNHSTNYILFWSRYGFSMRLVHKTKKISHYVTGDAIPTTPYIIPGTDKFSFMHQQGNGEVWIKELDPNTLAIRPLTAVIGSNRNYGWTPSGQIIMCDGTKLHRWSPKNPKSWELVADLGESGLQSITRVAVSPNGKHLAVVGVPSDP
jgi:hypothetical protein